MTHRTSSAPRFARPGRARRLVPSLMLASCSLWLISAAPPETGLEGLGRQVSDDELSEMRGKFVRADNIHFFGVEMVQSWTNSEGVTMLATLLFNVGFANGVGNPEGATPVIRISLDQSCDNCADPTMNVGALANQAGDPVLTVGRFESLQGLVQTQEIAGSDNDVLNTLSVSVVPNSSIQSLSPGEGSTIDASASLISDTGDVVDFEVARNQLGMSISRGGDSVRQGISGELNQAAQHVILQSSLNTIRNEMAITVGIEDVARIQQYNVQQAMSAMKGRGM